MKKKTSAKEDDLIGGVFTYVDWSGVVRKVRQTLESPGWFGDAYTCVKSVEGAYFSAIVLRVSLVPTRA